jgi:hypothetical protein
VEVSFFDNIISFFMIPITFETTLPTTIKVVGNIMEARQQRNIQQQDKPMLLLEQEQEPIPLQRSN